MTPAGAEPLYALDPEELPGRLGTDPDAGLSLDEARRRLEEHGRNELSAGRPTSPLALLLRQFRDLMVLILLAACVVSVAAWYLEGARGLPADAIVIGAIVVLNAALGFAQEYRAEKTIEELKKMAATRTRVLRDGKALSLDRGDLVPGDLVLLEEGDRVPADLVLLRAERLHLDESLLTGESTTVAKAPGPVPPGTPVDSRTCVLFAGTTVTGGRGAGLVVATGAGTELGGIAAGLGAGESTETPLERRLDRLGKQIGWAVLAISVAVGATLLGVEGKLDGSTLIRVLMFSVALAVAAVPEGLPAVLTISLSVGARRLASQNAVVRRLPAVETLGSVTTIVTDKTGTLTHNQMTVSRVVLDGRELQVTGQGYGSTGAVVGVEPGDEVLRLLMTAGVLASTADLHDEPGKGRQALGDPTEAALLVLAEKAGLDWRALRQQHAEVSAAPFSSDRRRMSSLRRAPDGALTLYVKGSLEALLGRCSRWCSGGRGVPLEEADRQRLLSREENLGDLGLRTLAIAYRPGLEGDAEAQEEDLTLLGLVGMGDPPRQEVPEALQRCHRAGIRVVMLTGDHPHTARAVARTIGLEGSDVALTGPEVDALEDAELDRRLRECNLFARVSPHAKLRIVDRLLAAGEVVAMTGDGVNDAPALQKVHVGVAMGSGTAVAIEASELVLLDDNFATIVTAVEGGRSVFGNVQKFIAFLFSGNTGVVLAMFLGTVIAGLMDLTWEGHVLLPLTAAQILWMNLVTDGAPAVAFSLGRSREEVLEAPPRHPEDPILSPSLWRFVLATGAWVALVLLVVFDLPYVGGLLTMPGIASDVPLLARSAAFYAVITTRLCNSMNFQALPGALLRLVAWRDVYVPAACFVSWVLTLGVLYTPALSSLFGLVPLPPGALVALTVLAPAVLVVGEGWKARFGVRMDGRPRAPEA